MYMLLTESLLTLKALEGLGPVCLFILTLCVASHWFKHDYTDEDNEERERSSR